MTKQDGHEIETLRQIRRILEEYESDSIHLETLVNELQRHLWQLEEVEEIEQLLTQWGTLEAIHSWREVEGEEENFGSHEKRIKDTIAQITSIVEELLHEKFEIIQRTPNKLDENWVMCTRCTEVWKLEENSKLVVCPECKKVYRNPKFES